MRKKLRGLEGGYNTFVQAKHQNSSCKDPQINSWWDTVLLFENYFATIMQGCTTHTQPSQGCVQLAKDTIMIMQACHKLATIMQGYVILLNNCQHEATTQS